MKLVALSFSVVLLSIGCSSAASGARSSDPVEGDSKSRGSSAPSSSAASSASASASTDPVQTTKVVDLKQKGLPFSITVPTCAKPTDPLVRIADNAKDVILLCELSARDELDGKQAFAVQVGLAKGKYTKDDVAQDLNFVRFLSTEKNDLEWEEKFFQEVRRDFLLRTILGGVEFACYPPAGTADPSLLAREKAACMSLQSN